MDLALEIHVSMQSYQSARPVNTSIVVRPRPSVLRRVRPHGANGWWCDRERVRVSRVNSRELERELIDELGLGNEHRLGRRSTSVSVREMRSHNSAVRAHNRVSHNPGKQLFEDWTVLAGVGI